jgi:cytoskeletal protein CcmA (bactofilin family)
MPPHEVRKLTVGRGIAFSGEISACDHLIVEGTVEARLPEGQRIEITETGLFRGTVVSAEADIGGRFEGEITVRGRLTVRATGRIEGKIQYGELAVEAGGTLEGDVRGIANGAGAGKSGGRTAQAKLSPAPLLGEPGDEPAGAAPADAQGELH